MRHLYGGRLKNSTLFHGQPRGRSCFSLIIPSASTAGPPTSGAFQVKQENSGADQRRALPTELEARLHLAFPKIQGPKRFGVNPSLCWNGNRFRGARGGDAASFLLNVCDID